MVNGVSIGLPVFNCAAFLKRCISSVLAQTFTNWELIIIDDGSTDDSVSVAREFLFDSRVRLYSDGVNKGLPSRLNEIVTLAKFELVARLDADDFCHRQRLEKCIRPFLVNESVDIVSSGLCSIDDHYHILGFRWSFPRSITLNDCIKNRSGILHATVVYKKNWAERNPYNPSNFRAEDFELWLSASAKDDLNVIFLPDILYFYYEVRNFNIKSYVKSFTSRLAVLIRELNFFPCVLECSILVFKTSVMVSLMMLKLNGRFLVSRRSLNTPPPKIPLSSIKDEIKFFKKSA